MVKNSKQITLQTVSDYGYVSYDLTIDGRTTNHVVFEEVAQRITHLTHSFVLTALSKAGKKLYTIKRNFEDFEYSFKFNSDEITSKLEVKKIVRAYTFSKFDKARTKDRAVLTPQKVILKPEDAAFNKTQEQIEKESLTRAKTEIEIAKLEAKEVLKNSTKADKGSDILGLSKLEANDEVTKTQLISLVEVGSKKIEVSQTKKKLKDIKKKNNKETTFKPKQKVKKENKFLSVFGQIHPRLNILFSIAIAMFITLISLYVSTNVTFGDNEPSYKKALIICLLAMGLVSTMVAYVRIYIKTKKVNHEK